MHRSLLFTLLLIFSISSVAQAQHGEHLAETDEPLPVPSFVDPAEHSMWMQPLGGGWQLMGMGQVFPHVNFGAPLSDDSPLQRTNFYVTQPTVMGNVESPNQLISLRTTLSFEGLTIPDGEATLGGWGEGFIDSRHPHTLLHEAMLSVNMWNAEPGRISLFGGKGFVPYGTDDPMGRPVQKFPTNHHLSQLLERFLIGGAFITDNGWNVEGAVFGGDEPEGPYDFSNIAPWGNSWSVRLGRRFGGGPGTLSTWEATGSFAQVRESHGDHTDLTTLYNMALRHAGDVQGGNLYGLVEASLSAPEQGDGFFSVLGETMLAQGAHLPYARLEYATRPEYERLGEPGTDEFFRYRHGHAAIAATRWLIGSLGYSHTITRSPIILRPYAEVQHHQVTADRGDVDPAGLFGTNNFWNVSFGIRLFLGGDQMRMGTYGVLDPMSLSHRDHHREMGHGHNH